MKGGSVDITVVTKDFCKLSCCHFSYDILFKRYQWRSCLRPTWKFTQRHCKEACWELHSLQQGFLKLLLALGDYGSPRPRVVPPASGNRVFPKIDRADGLFQIHTGNGIRHQHEIWACCLSYQGMCLNVLQKFRSLWTQLVTKKTDCG